MEQIIQVTPKEAEDTLMFLEWLKSYIRMWEIQEVTIPYPKGLNKYRLDDLIGTYKQTMR